MQNRAVGRLNLYVTRRRRIGAASDGVFVIIQEREIEREMALQRIDEGVDGAVAAPFDDQARTIRPRQCRNEFAAVGAGGRGHLLDERQGRVFQQIGLLEQRPNIRRGQLFAVAIHLRLRDARKLHLQRARQIEAVIGAQDIGEAALARLAVDADHRLVIATNVFGIDRQIGHLKQRVIALGLGVKAFLDGVLMRAGKSGVDQFADIGVALVHGQLVAMFNDLLQPIDVMQIQFGIDALGEHIERHGDDIDIAGALAIAK